MNRIWLHILLALLAGLGLGLAYSWLIAPSQFTEATPSILRADFKSDYRAVIAAAYASNHDLDRARSRLALLGDTDPVQALSAQAQQMLASGQSFENVRNIAELASDIQQGAVSFPRPNTPTKNVVTTAPMTETSLPLETPLETPNGQATFTATAVLETPFLLVTSTPRPTYTPQPP